MVNRMNEIYTISMEKLKEYLEANKGMPSEKEWNRFAVKNELLSSKTISFLSGMGFNTLCRKMMKQITHEKKKL